MKKQIKMTLIYFMDDTHTLLLERVKKDSINVSEGKWLGVGGKVDAGESFEDGAIREALEETGLQALGLHYKGQILFQGQQEEDCLTKVYVVKDWANELIPVNREGKLHWIAHNEVLSKPMWEGDKVFVPLLYKDQEFNLSLVYENKKLIKIIDHNE